MKNKQGITIAALIIAIIGLSVGFAAFSNTLQISSSASVNPDPSSLKVVFAKDYFTEQKTTLNQLDTTENGSYAVCDGKVFIATTDSEVLSYSIAQDYSSFGYYTKQSS